MAIRLICFCLKQRKLLANIHMTLNKDFLEKFVRRSICSITYYKVLYSYNSFFVFFLLQWTCLIYRSIDTLFLVLLIERMGTFSSSINSISSHQFSFISTSNTFPVSKESLLESFVGRDFSLIIISFMIQYSNDLVGLKYVWV